MIGSGVITGENERGKLVLRLKKPVTVWKGREYSSVNVLGQGDTIEVRGVIEPDGTLVPTSIISNIARVVGTVQHVVGRSVTVSETAQGVPVDTLVHLDNDSVYEDGATEADVVPQAKIEVIGVKLPDGSVTATKVMVYTQNSAHETAALNNKEQRPGSVVLGRFERHPDVLNGRW